ncbi:hypothetical protein NKH36_34010 [Mesorhizobium sp. M1312]|uniref:hypothetical protein n=1 Tax=unclassified Mesorhizobium TaxID=325217 RepID=UPI00333D0CE1
MLAGRYFLTERIANLKSRIERRDDEITALKEGRSSEEEANLPMVPMIAPKPTGESKRLRRSLGVYLSTPKTRYV